MLYFSRANQNISFDNLGSKIEVRGSNDFVSLHFYRNNAIHCLSMAFEGWATSLRLVEVMTAEIELRQHFYQP